VCAAQREHAEQLEKETLTFRPSLVTSPRVRSPSPQRGNRVTVDVMSPTGEGGGGGDTTPMRPLYNLGSGEIDEQSLPEDPSSSAILIPHPHSTVSPTQQQQSPHKETIPFYERLVLVQSMCVTAMLNVLFLVD
jgi:hypothetical protein